MQTHKILLNERLIQKGQLGDQSSNFVFLNGYYIHLDRIGGGMVNENNVRSFLNDIRNTDLIQRFVSFLTGSTTSDMFVEIVGSNLLLSNNFNRFHDEVILSGSSTLQPISHSDGNSISAHTIVAQNFNYVWNDGFEDAYMVGSQPSHINSTFYNESYSSVTLVSMEDGYYIPVFLKQGFDILNQEIPSLCSETIPIIQETISQNDYSRGNVVYPSMRYENTLQCFVNNNMETNHNYPYQWNQIPEVGFTRNSFSVLEGNNLRVGVSLSFPSQNGLEECEVSAENLDTDNNDFVSSVFPITINWNAGEMEKTIDLQANSDQLLENFEMLRLKITRAVNVSVSESNQETFITIEDDTELRNLSIVGFDEFPEGQSSRGNVSAYPIELLEGEFFDLSLSIDAPSYFGTEQVKVGVFSSNGQQTNSAQIESGNIVQWAIGDQNKTIRISAIRDSSIEGPQEYLIRVYDPEYIIIPSINEIRLIVNESPAERRYVALDVFNIYRQRGESGPINQTNSELVLGLIQNGTLTNPETLNCLIGLGSTYYDNTLTSLNESSQYVNYPLYSFATQEDGRKPKFVVKNTGTHPFDYDGVTYSVGDMLEVDIDEMSTFMVLPTNAGIMGFGQTPNGEITPLTADTLTTGSYEIYIKMPDPFLVDSLNNSIKDTHSFTLKNGQLNNNSRLIGEFSFQGKITQQDAIDNRLYLYSKYRNFRTTTMWNICVNSFNGDNKIKNVRIRGVIMLSQNSLSTNYHEHEFSEFNDFEPICGFNQASYLQNQLTGIPFEIY